MFVQYLKSDLNNSFDKKQLNELKAEIEKAEPISTEFIKVYERVNPITNTNGILFDGIKENYYKDCPCLNAARLSFIKGKNRLTGNELVLAWKLEKEFTQKQCLSFYVEKHNFLYENIGINQASEYYFNKKLAELNFDQMATLTLMIKNAALYNPKRNPEGIKQKIAELKN